MPQPRLTLSSARDWCAEALAVFVSDSSPSPFLDAHEFDVLFFQVEAELRAKMRSAPPDFVKAALSLLIEKPPANWPGWAAFNGSKDWDYALGIMLGEFARLYPDYFFREAEPLLQNPATLAQIISAVGVAVCFASTNKEPYKTWLSRFILEPSDLTADEIWSLEDLLTDAEKADFLARLSQNQKISLQELKKT